MDMFKEFFGMGVFHGNGYEYAREPEGAWSWQHLLFVSLLMVAMVALAIAVGLHYRHRSPEKKNRVLVFCAFAINEFELLKILVLCVRGQNPWHWLYVLPLFLCSIQLIAIPLAAFCKGFVRDAALDFVMIFGILGAVFGTIGAAQNYGCYPVLSMDNVFSGITHCISGFASLYIAISGLASMKKKNIPVTCGILFVFCVMAYVANVLLDYNYMFLMDHDGTPYSIFYNMVDGHPVLYPAVVVLLFFIYIALFYAVYFAIQRKRAKKAKKTVAPAATVSPVQAEEAPAQEETPCEEERELQLAGK